MRLLYVSCTSLVFSCSIVTDYGSPQTCETSSECAAGEECGGGLCRPAVDSDGAESPEEPRPPEASQEEPDGQEQDPMQIEVAVIGSELTRDTHVRLLEPGTNFGEELELVVDADPLARGLLRFRVDQVAELAAGVDVVSARLTLQVTDVFEDGNLVVYVVEEAWNESRATYTLRRADAPWSAPGGLNEDAQIPVATASPAALGALPIEIPVSAVQRWIDDPATNHGLWLISDSQEGRGGRFESSESVGAPPTLTVTIEGA